MVATAPAIDGVFRALADPTRRQVIARLAAGPASVTALAAPFAMALPSFTQHLRVLEDCGVVRSRKAGRVRTVELVPQRLRAAETWLADQRALWDRRLDQLDRFLSQHKDKPR